jgi:hypothetical protein
VFSSYPEEEEISKRVNKQERRTVEVLILISIH